MQSHLPAHSAERTGPNSTRQFTFRPRHTFPLSSIQSQETSSYSRRQLGKKDLCYRHTVESLEAEGKEEGLLGGLCRGREVEKAKKPKCAEGGEQFGPCAGSYAGKAQKEGARPLQHAAVIPLLGRQRQEDPCVASQLL